MKLDLAGVKKLAYNLGKKYQRRNITIGLTGQLGSGKTTFVKSFARAFGIRLAKSPTFVILNLYTYRNRDVYHFDFYRLHRISQLKPLGIAEIFGQRNRIILIEWVEKFPTIKRQCDLIIKFKILGKNARNITITKQ